METIENEIENEALEVPRGGSSPIMNSGSRVLRKAKSFRDELKTKIRRATSVPRQDGGALASMSPVTQKRSSRLSRPTSKSSMEGDSPCRSGESESSRKCRTSASKLPPTGKRKSLSRGMSFHEGKKVDRHEMVSDDDELSEIERLEAGSRKVHQALFFTEKVVTKGSVQQLSGSATVVLETVTEFHVTLSHYALNSDSSVLTSTWHQVHQSLAQLIHWADFLLLQGNAVELDQQVATVKIASVRDALQNLLELTVDKVRQKGLQPVPKVPTANNTTASNTPSTSNVVISPIILAKRRTAPTESIYDRPTTCHTEESLPLSEREKYLLQNAQALEQQSAEHSVSRDINSSERISRSCDDILETDSYPDEKPPPKPPLPPNVESLLRKRSPIITRSPAGSNAGSNSSIETSKTDNISYTPPPLPRKKYSLPEKDFMGNPLPVFPLKSFNTEPYHHRLSQDTISTTDTTPACSDSSLNESLDKKHVSHARFLLSSAPLTDDVFEKPKERRHTVSSGSRLSHYDNLNVTAMLNNTTIFQHKSAYTAKQGLRLSEASIDTTDEEELVKSSTDTLDDISTAIQATKENELFAVSPLVGGIDKLPPTLPIKRGGGKRSPKASLASPTSPKPESRHRVQFRRQSEYDNVMPAMSRLSHTSSSISSSTHTSFDTSSVISSTSSDFQKHVKFDGLDSDDGGDPPPLPLKKKFVNAYMDMIGVSQSRPPTTNIRMGRHSVHSVNFYEQERYQHQMNMFHFYNGLQRAGTLPAHHPNRPTSDASLGSNSSSNGATKHRVSDTSVGSTEDVVSLTSGTSSSTDDTTLVQHLDNLNLTSSDCQHSDNHGSMTTMKSGAGSISNAPSTSADSGIAVSNHSGFNTENSAVIKPCAQRRSEPLNSAASLDEATLTLMRHSAPIVHQKSVDAITEHSGEIDENGDYILPATTKPLDKVEKKAECADDNYADLCTLDHTDVSHMITRRHSQSDDGPTVSAGSTDALVVYATITSKTEFMYQEAFLTTYRCFLSPRDLVDKLLYRYKRMSEVRKEKLARNTFSLLIRVLDDLSMEVDSSLLEALMKLVFELLCDGELMLARILRTKVLEKCETREKIRKQAKNPKLLPSYQLASKPHSLRNLKSVHIAEQMTLLDCELFHKIELPEVLLWARKQSEEQSPNLTKFTEHFNKVSYWCRTRILELEDSKEREHCLIKFIKVMKHLRKLSNFNSYLAILSALDSAPVRRLEWPKQSIEVLHEFCQLIDSSSSFRVYRTALSETEPPCIPYIGLVLQDLTFIHLGNPDETQDGDINFAKCWQQFQILDNMRRFRNSHYRKLRKESKILAYFNNFDNYLSEESLWQISESIKPRCVRKKTPAPDLMLPKD